MQCGPNQDNQRPGQGVFVVNKNAKFTFVNPAIYAHLKASDESDSVFGLSRGDDDDDNVVCREY
jgi:hypothetical protein